MLFQIKLAGRLTRRDFGRVRRVRDRDDVRLAYWVNDQVLRQLVYGALNPHGLSRWRSRKPAGLLIGQATVLDDLGKQVLAGQQLNFGIDLVFGDFRVGHRAGLGVRGRYSDIHALVLHQNLHARFVFIGKDEGDYDRADEDRHET